MPADRARQIPSGKTLELARIKYTLLFVDDEKGVLNSLVRLFRKEGYEVLTAPSAAQAWRILKDRTVHVLVTDYRMPGTTGVALLKKVKIAYPDTIRIMLTGYADIDAVMAAVNQGAVYKFVTKPWNDNDLKLTIRLAVEQYDLALENRQLKESRQAQTRNIDKLSRFINKSRLADTLHRNGRIPEKALREAKLAQAQSGEPMPVILSRMGAFSENQMMGFMEKAFDIHPVDLSKTEILADLTSVLPREICTSNCLIPIGKKDGALVVAMADPTDQMKVEALKYLTGMAIRARSAPPDEIMGKIDEVYAQTLPENSDPGAFDFIEAQDSNVVNIESTGLPEDIRELFSGDQTPSAMRVVDAVILDALEKEASDVHIEAKSRFVMVRYRLSGLLADMMHIPLVMHPAIVSRIKVMAGLDIAERRRPQDGRITVRAAGRLVDMRLSTLPTIAGEKVVFRILDRNNSITDMEELGMMDSQIRLVTRMIQKPQGCMLVTGPTGSGKTSTLYSLIHKTATIQKNYTTIEDPVEYYMEKAEQVMIKEKIGLTFPVVLRTLLRQDPDTIMLGEIRDFETAEVAFHAALTGHTVLSTLHTNSCVATITRLMDMGMQSHVISSALNGIIAQRLVRRICPHCMVDDPVSEDIRIALGLENGPGFQAKRGQGCEQCGQTGYQGRTGIYEVFNINHEIEMLLQQGATEGEIQKAALAGGMTLLIDAGLEKIQMGITTCDEILRVLGPQNLQQYQCPACGKGMAERFRFCPYCAVQIQLFCRSCSRSLNPDWAACPDCGTIQASSSGRTKP